MGVRGVELLQRLGSGVRPEGAGASGPVAALDGKSFASLLADVGAGKVSSGRPVQIAAHSDVDLSAEQLERLALVADAGEASGATRLGVMIDGTLVTLDLLTRTVEGTSGDGDVLTGIDGFVVAPRSSEAGGAAGVLGGIVHGRLGVGEGLGMVRNRAVAELLGTLGVGRGSAGTIDGS